MFISIFDIFKVGIGPSSSHTMGPMIAGARFLEKVSQAPEGIVGFRASLHGSLAFTGAGHATDQAVILGLAGFKPDTFNADTAVATLLSIKSQKIISPKGLGTFTFDADTDLIFDYDLQLEGHANGMVLMALNAQHDVVIKEVYYSVGGGFVLTAEEMAAVTNDQKHSSCPYPFSSASQMLDMASETSKSIAQLKLANELEQRDGQTIEAGITRIWEVMNSCINRGLTAHGTLAGGLNVQRRAAKIYQNLLPNGTSGFVSPNKLNDWVCAYAMAVNEENAAGGQVVTAPTNGAAGVIPATLRYWLDHVPDASAERIAEFLLTAAAIGGIIKHNASISGAECGCQAEVGSASAMAAAGLTAVVGGTPKQVENAAEIALEHHLGMTCDPVLGLVQVPCIERNGLGAIKAISACSLALHGDGKHIVSLDAVIETMRQTGADMSSKYKETALGGLSVNVPNC